MKKIITVFLLPLVLSAQAQKGFKPNYDEAKVPAYSLPDLLTTASNAKVKTSKQWEEIRRPQLIKLFEDHVYGQLPREYESLNYRVVNEDAGAIGGKAKLKEVLIEVSKKGKAVKIALTLLVPNDVKKPAPLFLLLNNRGKENTDPARVVKSEFWPAELLIDSGYAIAAIQVSDLAPDDPLNYVSGALQLYPEQLLAGNGMKTIGAWAWGASRVMDYFEKDRDIDASRVALVGHSRGGKAALWAAAADQRFAICITNCSGNTGAALARRQFGERIHVINSAFPHWFSNNYKNYNYKEHLLPVDQHMLIALMAPRPVYATSASEDGWADPKGTFLALKESEKAYALYSLKAGLPQNPPGINQPIVHSPIGYHNRKGKHDLTSYDWENFIRFANHNYKKFQ